MMSENAADYHALFLTNVALATEMEKQFPAHRGWTCVVRFYAALHLMNAYLIDKQNLRFDPESTEHKARNHAMAQCPELRDAREKYSWLKNLSESVRYDVAYEYADEDRADSIAWLAKIVAIVEPKLKKA
ncbi:MAG: hypothetical protein HY289_07355 [Planctomycetes bacterium]|nr:hypothetical protein [Planctomycetota bacterium]